MTRVNYLYFIYLSETTKAFLMRFVVLRYSIVKIPVCLALSLLSSYVTDDENDKILEMSYIKETVYSFVCSQSNI